MLNICMVINQCESMDSESCLSLQECGHFPKLLVAFHYTFRIYFTIFILISVVFNISIFFIIAIPNNIITITSFFPAAGILWVSSCRKFGIQLYFYEETVFTSWIDKLSMFDQSPVPLPIDKSHYGKHEVFYVKTQSPSWTVPHPYPHRLL